MFDKSMFNKQAIKNGDCFAVTVEPTLNNRRLTIFRAMEMLWVSPCQNWEGVKNIQKSSKGYEKYAQINARNAGVQVKVYRLKNDLIRELSRILDEDGFEQVKCHVLEKERTASAIPPFITYEKSNTKPIYLRITPENQLKQTSAILLKSVYTIDSVFFNKDPGAKHQPEMCTLEFVALDYTEQEILAFMIKVNTIMNRLAKKYGFDTDNVDVPRVVDYNDLESLHIKYDRRIPEFRNTILINAPVNSPFVKVNSNGMRTEIKWYINGSLTGHGYSDETDCQQIKISLEQQKIANNLEQINEMSYFEWGLPKSVSFGLGIDALVYRYLNLEHMALASNPLGINYVNHRKNDFQYI